MACLNQTGTSELKWLLARLDEVTSVFQPNARRDKFDDMNSIGLV